MAGLGNMYSDEILFAAGLRYDRTASGLSTQEIRRLYRSVVETLHDAVKYRGSTLADQGYVDLFGKAGDYQEHHKVYARDGSPAGAAGPRSRRSGSTAAPRTTAPVPGLRPPRARL